MVIKDRTELEEMVSRCITAVGEGTETVDRKPEWLLLALIITTQKKTHFLKQL